MIEPSQSPAETSGTSARSGAGLVSIVLPVHNQADHVSEFVEQYEEALATLPCPHEILLVTNNCRDHSAEACRALAARYPSVRTVDSEKGGWGLAVKLGLAQARGNVLCYTNSARTTATELHDLVAYALNNPDVVVKAHRMSRESLHRKIGSLLYNAECRLLFHIPAWDINATPKVFSRKTYEAVQLQSDGDLIDLEFYVKCARLRTLIVELPIYSMGRHGGKSTTNFRSAWRLYCGAWLMWRDSLHQRGVFASLPPASS